MTFKKLQYDCNSYGLKNNKWWLVLRFNLLLVIAQATDLLELWAHKMFKIFCFVCFFSYSSSKRFWSFLTLELSLTCSMLCFLATGDVAMSWLAVETSDVPYILKLASDDLTSWAAGDTEMRWTSLHRCNFCCKNLVSSWIFGVNRP